MWDLAVLGLGFTGLGVCGFTGVWLWGLGSLRWKALFALTGAKP